MPPTGNPKAPLRSSAAAAGLLGLLASLFTACPAINASPCSTDGDCANGRCRRGACGPVCLVDSECGTEQVCSGGKCLPRPECQKDGDCAEGFTCTGGLCRCTADAACASNQSCVEGRCQTQERCTGDEDCAGTGRRCELTQGLCVPVCASASDCAPGMTAAMAAALYQCFQGTCYRHCLNDLTCGQGLICKDGLCALADCKTMTDCPQGQYCSSGLFGRCLEYTPCTSAASCAANFECKPFTQALCPPGFPCAQPVCQELPTCLIDPDCLPAGRPLPGESPSYCQEGHCQKTTRCLQTAQCQPGAACVGGLCVPGGCRGLTDCPAGQACVGGTCATAPAPGDIDRLKLVPTRSLVEVSDTLQFTLIAYRLDGSSYPLSAGTFAVVDEAGAPSSAGTIDGSGLFTAVFAGKLTVRGSVAGANVPVQQAQVTVVAAVTAGRRVLVVGAADGAPLEGVVVRGCEAPPAGLPCPSPLDVTTSASGEALFPAFGPGPASFTAASLAIRADGLPRYDVASVLSTSAAGVLLPLGDNPVHAAAGFNAAIQFSEVHSNGQYWAGFAALSAGNLPELSLGTLLGELFQVNVPAINQKVPVPGSVVLYTSPGFGIAQEIKGKSLGLGQAGVRNSVAFAGRTGLDQALSMRSLGFLAYTGAMDYALQPGVAVSTRPRVQDSSDINNNGLCSQPQRCPSGSEEVPDYVAFPALSFGPKRQQNRRTEVVLPNVPVSLDTVVVAAVETSQEAGVFPLGFSSSTAGAPQNGTRPVPGVTLRSGAPYAGTEVATPGLWALATSAQSLGDLAGGDLTARLTRSPVLPTRVVVKPFLPIANRSSYAPATRTFSPGQPDWNAVFSAGGSLAQLILTSAQGRHVVYFEISGSQTAVRVPEAPPGAVPDPAAQGTARLQVIALDLVAGTTADEAFTLKGPNLWQLANHLDGYSRFQP